MCSDIKAGALLDFWQYHTSRQRKQTERDENPFKRRRSRLFLWLFLTEVSLGRREVFISLRVKNGRVLAVAIDRLAILR